MFQKPPPGFSRGAADLYGEDASRATALHTALEALKPHTDWRPSTLVWNLRPGTRLLDVRGPAGHAEIAYEKLILCTGAMDRVVPIPGWTQPGVTSLGAAQIALKTQGLAMGRRVALCGTGPLLLLLAWQLTKAGAPPVLVLESSPWATTLRASPGLALNPAAVLRGLSWRARLSVRTGAVPLRIEPGCTALVWRDGRGEHRTEVDAVALGWGLKPETQLADLAGVPFAFDRAQRLWLPECDAAGRTAVPGVFLAGDGASIGGSVMAELAGARAALAALGDDRSAALDRAIAREARFRRALDLAYPYPHALAAAMPDETLLCRCEAITAAELRAHAAEPQQPAAPEINRGKALTRVGMGRCQGRLCGPPAAEVLASALGCDIAEVGRLRGQMPVKPVVMA